MNYLLIILDIRFIDMTSLEILVLNITITVEARKNIVISVRLYEDFLRGRGCVCVTERKHQKQRLIELVELNSIDFIPLFTYFFLLI